MDFENFVFFGSWRDTLMGFKEEFGEQYAYEALWNLMLAGTGGDVETTKASILGFISGSCMPNIIASKERYERANKGGKKGGRPKLLLETDQKEIARLRMEGQTREQIAEAFEVSIDTIKRSDGWRNWQDYGAKVQNSEAKGQNDAKVLPQSDKNSGQNGAKWRCKSQNPEKDIDIEKDRDIDYNESTSCEVDSRDAYASPQKIFISSSGLQTSLFEIRDANYKLFREIRDSGRVHNMANLKKFLEERGIEIVIG